MSRLLCRAAPFPLDGGRFELGEGFSTSRSVDGGWVVAWSMDIDDRLLGDAEMNVRSRSSREGNRSSAESSPGRDGTFTGARNAED